MEDDSSELTQGCETGVAGNPLHLVRHRRKAAPRAEDQSLDIRSLPMLGLTQLSNYLILKGSFSAVSKPNFASKYALESSRRDLQNALLCTGLVESVWVKKYTKINIEKMKSGKLFSDFQTKIELRQR